MRASVSSTQEPMKPGLARAAIGQDKIGLKQVVQGQTILSGQVARSTAQGETGDPGGGDDSGRDCQAKAKISR